MNPSDDCGNPSCTICHPNQPVKSEKTYKIQQTLTRDELVAATLQWVNNHRVSRGYRALARLAHGDNSAGTCPVALSLAIGQSGTQYSVSTSGWAKYDRYTDAPNQEVGSGPVSPEVAKFIVAFDTGDFPEYNLFV